MLEIKHLCVQIADRQVIQDCSIHCLPGKHVCILGKNGSGKSSLALAIMGHPDYTVTSGDILLDGESILDRSVDRRARAGIFLAFQSIPEIPGVKLFEFLRTIYNTRYDKKESFVSFKKIILPYLEELHIDKEFLRRDLNVGFSGGEKRKIEILQVKLLQPRYVFLDEVDSGLDVDAFRAVVELLATLATDKMSFIIITHYFTILEHLPVDQVVLIQDGRVIETGGKEIVKRIQKEGFDGTKS